MVNEASLNERHSDPVAFEVNDGTGIEKGAVLKQLDARKAALSDGQHDIVAGIAATEKIANDGRTALGVFRNGVFTLVASGAINHGELVGTQSGSNNYIKSIDGNNLSGAKGLGVALETSADGENVQIEVNPRTSN